jgi:hypothetical protein
MTSENGGQTNQEKEEHLKDNENIIYGRQHEESL